MLRNCPHCGGLLKKEKELRKTNCAICDKEFTFKRTGAVYCSNACKVKAYKRQKTLLSPRID